EVLLAHSEAGYGTGAAGEPITVILAETEGPELAALLGFVYTGSASLPRPLLDPFVRAAEALRIRLPALEPTTTICTSNLGVTPGVSLPWAPLPLALMAKQPKPEICDSGCDCGCTSALVSLERTSTWCTGNPAAGITATGIVSRLQQPRRQVANHVTASPWAQISRPQPALPRPPPHPVLVASSTGYLQNCSSVTEQNGSATTSSSWNSPIVPSPTRSSQQIPHHQQSHQSQHGPVREAGARGASLVGVARGSQAYSCCLSPMAGELPHQQLLQQAPEDFCSPYANSRAASVASAPPLAYSASLPPPPIPASVPSCCSPTAIKSTTTITTPTKIKPALSLPVSRLCGSLSDEHQNEDKVQVECKEEPMEQPRRSQSLPLPIQEMVVGSKPPRPGSRICSDDNNNNSEQPIGVSQQQPQICGTDLSVDLTSRQNQEHLQQQGSERDGTPGLHRCEHCAKTFVTKASLKVHQRTHSGEKPFRCCDCGKQFSQLRNYKYHRSVHEGTREFAASCPECGKYFNDRGYLSSHMKIHRNRKEYACAECGKSFNQRVAYNMHVRIHTGLKPHVCSECGKAFSRKMLLKQHLRTHSGERPYQCSVCNKAFADRSNMTLHTRLHSGLKPYQCHLCSKAFTKKHHLKTHLNYHTGTKPYACPNCQLRFSQSSNMRTHYKKCALNNKQQNPGIPDSTSTAMPAVGAGVSLVQVPTSSNS
ncbi:hypothetical protein QAD02_016966, partial [Eretmocerus hayati]